jgi:hypothetical protein
MAAKKAKCAESKKEERYRGGNARRAPDGSTPNAAAIFRQFMDGASMKRLARKHSLPLLVVEIIIRCQM